MTLGAARQCNGQQRAPRSACHGRFPARCNPTAPEQLAVQSAPSPNAPLQLQPAAGRFLLGSSSCLGVIGEYIESLSDGRPSCNENSRRNAL
eukprot:CAMPEP_0181181096 /NCGR_PEP_ID=MMETSP1096-20121128/7154_1 /TAXON_ID=156174 ORGANISM="Chrysochromulina ericina, Strain CCMP281" /NCGR_SAMPLE_ID=MMETSP1096 /ASSEMBLY_ACC=CAM_ASM_000453 /LENGTH=91 /DNA_ID=CAMNT_0023269575 /DNA_START=302 /DNA_END=577 /DNA_ORIENTATION=-